MNLFCFTLEGSTDSVYQPSQRIQGLNELSPGPRRRPCSPKFLLDSSKWGGSEPCITKDHSPMPTPQLNKADLRKAKRKSLPAASTSDKEHTASSKVHWLYSRKKDETVFTSNLQNDDKDREACMPKAMGEEEGMVTKVERREKEHHVQGMNFEAWNPHRETGENMQQDPSGDIDGEGRGKKKMIQKLVRVKKTHTEDSRSMSEPCYEMFPSIRTSHLTGTLSKEDRPVLTCIGLAQKPEKRLKKEQQSHLMPEKEMESSEIEVPWRLASWINIDVFPAWENSHHTCHKTNADQSPYDFNFTVSSNKEPDWYEEMFKGLNHVEQDKAPQRVIQTLASLESVESRRSSSFGRFDSPKYHAKPEEHDGTLVADSESLQNDHHKGGLGKTMKALSMTMRKKMGRKYVKALSEETGEDHDRNPEGVGQGNGGDGLAKDCNMSSNSVESLYSLHSGQSSSSGVTSGSDGSSNRDSLRLEEEFHYSGQFCGKAKVHTDFLPSPYDTESLKLKVGDVIDIISKPPMGIWTGMLNGKVGNFKFIYVEVLPEEPRPMQRMRANRKSRRPRPKTLQELLERLNLKDLESSLLINGYQTVDDLKYLKEQHLIELNVTDPEQRQRLLAATEGLQDAEMNSQKDEDAGVPESPQEPVKVEPSECPRDSGCYVASDCSDNSREDAEKHRTESLESPQAEA